MNVACTVDAEMHALRGALLEALWAVDKTNIPFADQALKAFEKSFVMCNDVHEPVLAGIGYGLARYDKISTRVALFSLVCNTAPLYCWYFVRCSFCLSYVLFSLHPNLLSALLCYPLSCIN